MTRFNKLFMMLAAAGSLHLAVAAAEQTKTSPYEGMVVELFTSHGCSSCPPADKVFGELLSEHPGLVGLEFHVDYWDQLVHGSAGNFVDPYSDSGYTLRQQVYNTKKLGGRGGVYTPQAIVNGEYAAVGSQKRYITHALANAQARPLVPQLEFDGNRLQVEIAHPALTPKQAGAEVWLAVYDIETKTNITGGENKDRTLVNHHVVRSLLSLGKLDRFEESSAFDIDVALAEGQGCAVMVQNSSPAAVLGAANCPIQ